MAGRVVISMLSLIDFDNIEESQVPTKPIEAFMKIRVDCIWSGILFDILQLFDFDLGFQLKQITFLAIKLNKN